MIELLVRIKQSDRGKGKGIELVRQLISEQLRIDINTNEVELKSANEIKGATLQSLTILRQPIVKSKTKR